MGENGAYSPCTMFDPLYNPDRECNTWTVQCRKISARYPTQWYQIYMNKQDTLKLVFRCNCRALKKYIHSGWRLSSTRYSLDRNMLLEKAQRARQWRNQGRCRHIHAHFLPTGDPRNIHYNYKATARVTSHLTRLSILRKGLISVKITHAENQQHADRDTDMSGDLRHKGETTTIQNNWPSYTEIFLY